MKGLIVALALLALVPSALTAAPAASPGIIRGIYANPGAAIDNRLWAAYGAGYEEVADEKHGGNRSIRCANSAATEGRGAGQVIRLDQEQARPIVVSGWAKLEGVTGAKDYHCSVYLDLALKDGQSWPMRIAAFDPAKEGWQHAEETYTPPAPIVSARVYVFLRERGGTAWFDDIGVCEVLDDAGTRGKNLLLDPGFEGGGVGDSSLRDRFFGKLTEVGCNAFHLYRSVGWEKIMGEDPSQPPGPLPAIDPKDPFLDFVADAHRRGFKVWLTVGLGLPRITNTRSKEFPFWPCVNNRWGESYTRAIAYFTQYGVDGIGMVPDEWNYHNGAVKDWAKHPDPEVGKFYEEMPWHCACDVCRARFRERTGRDYPDVRKPWGGPDPIWADYTRFRYDSTAAWTQRSVRAAKAVNPNVVTDTMICVLPVCSDDRRSTGAAWDQLGAETELDCLQTDPYIQLHNYLGDSTHYYTTETALHLASANWQRRAGVTLEVCRLYERYRDKDPADVYGSALSCLAHGATEFFWWYFSYVNGDVKYVDPGPPSRRLAATYRVMKEMELYLLGARASGDLLVLYSRKSEDTWHWLASKEVRAPICGLQENPKRGFVAHRNVLNWLLRRGYPFRMTFAENPDPALLAAAKVILVPFPFSLSDSEAKAIEEQVRAGKTVILFSELSPVDERGQLMNPPRLAPLFPGEEIDPDEGRATEAHLGKGRAIYLGCDFAVRLFQETPPMKDPKVRVPLPAFDHGCTAALEKLLAGAPGRPIRLFAAQPATDVEATLLNGPRGRVLLLTNWDTEKAEQVSLLQSAVGGPARAQGFAILGDASVKPLRGPYSGERWSFRLAPQETRLLWLSALAGR